MESIGVLWNHDQTEDQFLLPLCHRRNHRQDGRSRPPRPYLYAQQNRGRLHNLTPRTATHQQRQQAEAQNRRSYSGADARGQQDGRATMTNLQLLLTIGIPSILVILSWLSNRQDFRDLSAKVDRHYENFNNQVTTLLTTIHNVDTRVVKIEAEKK
jgi:N-acetylmuramoyl-L-alanine amidase